MAVAQIQLGDITVEVIKKDIKNVHLSVNPSTGSFLPWEMSTMNTAKISTTGSAASADIPLANVPFDVLQLDHVVLRSTDPARLEDFYVRILGCPVELRQEKFGLTQLRAGRALIDILAIGSGTAASPGSARGNMDHLCLRIEPFDAAAIQAHLERHKIAFGEIAPRFGADGRGPSIYIEDPDGNRIELKGPPVA